MLLFYKKEEYAQGFATNTSNAHKIVCKWGCFGVWWVMAGKWRSEAIINGTLTWHVVYTCCTAKDTNNEKMLFNKTSF